MKGMPLSKMMLEKMNGEISIQSKKGVGTTALVTLPAIPFVEPQGRISNNQIVNQSHREPKRILSVLVVDDDPTNRFFQLTDLP